MFSTNFLTVQKLNEWNTTLQLGLTSRAVKKGALLLKAGQRCDYFYYISKGFMRMYYLDLNGEEITHWFAAENAIITSPFSLLKRETNILYIQALEDTEVWRITLDQVNTIATEIKLADKAIRNLYAEFAMVFSRKVMDMHTKTAEERYLKLMDEHPYLFQKAKLSHIASYLGITPQSLSRIRKNI